MRRDLLRLPAAALAVAALGIAGCGSGSTTTSPPPLPKPPATAAAFPAVKGRTLAALQAGIPEGPILAPSVSILAPGRDRYGFALFDRSRRFIDGVGVALYTARKDGSGVLGPFPARIESLKVRPAFQSQTTAQDPSAARQVYVAEPRFAGSGAHVVTALALQDGKLVRTNEFSAAVGGDPATQPPRVGDHAIRVHTPTLASAGGRAATIDTRLPPATDLLQDDLASVLGHKPVVLEFATPQLCQSRVCGPVVDEEEQAASDVGSKVAFIHVEIYNHNQVDKGLRPQPAAYRLPSEPWTFVIDRHGIIRTRLEGAFSYGELERAVAKVD